MWFIYPLSPGQTNPSSILYSWKFKHLTGDCSHKHNSCSMSNYSEDTKNKTFSLKVTEKVRQRARAHVETVSTRYLQFWCIASLYVTGRSHIRVDKLLCFPDARLRAEASLCRSPLSNSQCQTHSSRALPLLKRHPTRQHLNSFKDTRWNWIITRRVYAIQLKIHSQNLNSIFLSQFYEQWKMQVYVVYCRLS